MARRSGFDYRVPRDMRILRQTKLTSGTGVFVPLYDGVLARVILLGGGGSGGFYAGSAGSGGGGGCTVFLDMPLQGATWEYVVGSGGVATSGAGNAGGTTYFGHYIAPGGAGGDTTTSNGRATGGTSSYTNCSVISSVTGGTSGAGRTENAQLALAYRIGTSTSDSRQTALVAAGTWLCGCGGHTPFGIGGDAVRPTGKGFGVGGRGGGSIAPATNGASGLIIVIEME